MEEFCAGDEQLMAKCKEICSWFPSMNALVMHSLGLTLEVTRDELKRMVPGDKGAISMEILLWAMAEAMESPDPRQRARWYEYRSRISSLNSEAEGPVNLRIIDVVDEETEEEDADDEEEEEEDADEEEEEEEDADEEEDTFWIVMRFGFPTSSWFCMFKNSASCKTYLK